MRSLGNESRFSKVEQHGARAIWLLLVILLMAIGSAASPGRNGTTSSPAPGQALYDVSTFAGATAGDQITACIKSLPRSGGICDARSLSSPLSIPNGLDISTPVEIIFGYGVIQLGGTILIHDTTAAAIIGQTVDWNLASGTTFQWVGNGLDPAFDLSSVTRGRLEHFGITIAGKNFLAAGIRLERGARSNQCPTQNHIEDIFINSGPTPGAIDKGVQLALGGGGDVNNDYNEFISVQVWYYGTAGFSIEHPMAKQQRFFRCTAYGMEIGKYGITTALGPNYGGGSFSWYGGGFSGNTEADVYLGALNDSIVIDGGYSENSVRFLETFGNSAAAWPVTVKGFTWNGDNLGSDGNMIIFTQRGGLTLIGNKFGAPGKPGRIFGNPTGVSALVAIANSIISTFPQPFGGTAWVKWTLLGNTVSTDGVLSVPLPNAVP